MTNAMNIAAVEKATGKSWEQWLKFFDSIGASELTHKEIAEKVHDSGTPSWWSQNVTVAYEQHIGRRVPGQQGDGTYEVSVTKTLVGTLDSIFNLWLDKASDMKEFSNIATSGMPNVSKTDRWRYWRVNLSDGTKIVVSISEKPLGKVLLAITQQKLTTKEQVEHWRIYWKQFLARF